VCLGEYQGTLLQLKQSEESHVLLEEGILERGDEERL